MVWAWSLALLQTLLALLLAPLLVGLISWLKARAQNRRGAPPWQPYRDLRRLLAKEAVVSRHASWLFRFAPALVFAATVTAAALVPAIALGLPSDNLGDLLVVVSLLLLATFFLALAGLDPGSAFGGMGSSREMTIASLAEPTMLMAIFSLSLAAGTTQLGRIAAAALTQGIALRPAAILAFVAMFIAMLAENARLPVDNPTTHLELTMVHEAMILEYSGRHLALVEWAAWTRLYVFLAMLANLFFPWGVARTLEPAALAWALLALLGKLALLGAAIAALETRVAKLRLFRVPELLSVSFILAFLAVAASLF
jgi:formate hydrogenlyase subunit 4